MDAITDEELLQFKANQKRLKELAAEIGKLEKLVEAQNSELVEKIQAGVPFAGKVKAVVADKVGQCRPHWQEEWTICKQKEGLGQVQIENEIQRIKQKYLPKVTKVVVVSTE